MTEYWRDYYENREKARLETHHCHTPPDGHPGDVYVCDCGNSYLAVDTVPTEWDRLNTRDH